MKIWKKYFSNYSVKIKRTTLPNSFYPASIILTSKSNKNQIKKIIDQSEHRHNNSQFNSGKYNSETHHKDHPPWFNMHKSKNTIYNLSPIQTRGQIILLDTEEDFDKIQHTFITKVVEK